MREFSLSKDEVKISVGRLDELKDVKYIASPTCPVRVIITVEKLREGWDCPFAYVLCSLKETRSATAIEQIVGRILRLPNAKMKRHPDLNCSYAFSVSESITDVLAELREALEHNGFTAAEAERIIIPVPQGTLPLGMQQKTVTFAPTEIDSTIVPVQETALGGKVRIDVPGGSITILVPLDRDDLEKVQAVSRRRAPKPKSRKPPSSYARQNRPSEEAGSRESLLPMSNSWIFSCRCCASTKMECCTSSRARSCSNTPGS